MAPIIGKDLIVLKIDQDRTIGGMEVKQRYAGEYGGIPVFYVLEPDGTIVEDSFNEDDRNVGAPAADWEIAWFGEVMRKAARRMTDGEIAFLLETMRDGAS